MKLIYKFKKERLENGLFISRPTINVVLKGNKSNIELPALIDSGCDRTVIPKKIAQLLRLDCSGKKNTLLGYCESTEVIESKATMMFRGKNQRQSVNIHNLPILISTQKDHSEEIVIGLEGVFDMFDITFRKAKNKIILKKIV